MKHKHVYTENEDISNTEHNFQLSPNFKFQDLHFYNLNLKRIVLYLPLKRFITLK